MEGDAGKGSEGREVGGSGGERSMMGREPRRCLRHLHDHCGAAAGGGVCPTCLRHGLLLLCPKCAHVRPCPCHTSSSPSSSSSSPPADSSSASSSSSSPSSPDLASSRRRGSFSVGRGRRRPPERKEEGEKGNVPRSSSIGVAGCGKGGGLKWLNWVFSMAARAFGGPTEDGQGRQRATGRSLVLK